MHARFRAAEYLYRKWNCIIQISNSILVDNFENYLYEVHFYDTWLSYVVKRRNFSTPNCFELFQNYPNPFYPAINISFSLAKTSNISLSIFNTIDEKIHELLNDDFSHGFHNINWNAINYSSSIYCYQIKSESQIITKQSILLK